MNYLIAELRGLCSNSIHTCVHYWFVRNAVGVCLCKHIGFSAIGLARHHRVGRNTLSFSVSASGFNNPTYSVSDSFGGSSVSNNNINAYGNFSWTPGTTMPVRTTSHSRERLERQQHQPCRADHGNDDANLLNRRRSGYHPSLTPGTSVVVGNPLTFTAAASSFVNRPLPLATRLWAVQSPMPI